MQDMYVTVRNKDGSYIGNILLSAFTDEEAAQIIKEQASRLSVLEEKLNYLKQEVVELTERLDNIQYPQD